MLPVTGRPWRTFWRSWKRFESEFIRSFMKVVSGALFFFVLIGSSLQAFDHAAKNQEGAGSWVIGGFHDAAAELEIEKKFIAVPDANPAKNHLRILTRAPHIAGSAEEKTPAEYVATKFREAG